MSERLVVGLTGHSKTGKTTVAAYLHEKYDFVVFEGSSAIKKEAEVAGISLAGRSDYDNFFRCLQLSKSRKWLANACLEQDGDKLVHSGLRAKYDLLRYREVGGLIIALVCPDEICVERTNAENPENPITLDDYQAIKQLESSPDDLGSHTGWCIENADFRVDSSGTPEQTFAYVDAIIAPVIVKHTTSQQM